MLDLQSVNACKLKFWTITMSLLTGLLLHNIIFERVLWPVDHTICTQTQPFLSIFGLSQSDFLVQDCHGFLSMIP